MESIYKLIRHHEKKVKKHKYMIYWLNVYSNAELQEMNLKKFINENDKLGLIGYLTISKRSALKDIERIETLKNYILERYRKHY